ncbi:MAG TPA: protein-L-isoaspartate O-methyltransferase [Thermoplasmata archaeon]|nr:protein-L-isoaspartate O-methyltransferase [Thermoplasmata archaeon]
MSAATEGSWADEAAEMVRTLGPLPAPIAAAMRRVPRHLFVPPRWRDAAYADEPLPLPGGAATISAPHMVALQLETAALAPGLGVLEVGTGLGYLAALLSELVGSGTTVHSVEVDPVLVAGAVRSLAAAGYSDRVEVHAANGQFGWPPAAPYDRVIVSCAAPAILPSWRSQVVERGTVVAPVGGPEEQVLVRWTRHGEGGEFEEGPRCRFVPLVSTR